MKFAQGDRRKVRAAVELTPLIDVVFQLLIFFMLSSTFVVQRSIQIEVPEAEGAVVLEQKDLSITIAYGDGGPDNGGPVYVNEVSVDTWRELSQKLSDAYAARPDAMVLIRPDARVPVERLVRVLGIASSVGIEHYGIAAQPPEVE